MLLLFVTNFQDALFLEIEVYYTSTGQYDDDI